MTFSVFPRPWPCRTVGTRQSLSSASIFVPNFRGLLFIKLPNFLLFRQFYSRLVLWNIDVTKVLPKSYPKALSKIRLMNFNLCPQISWFSNNVLASNILKKFKTLNRAILPEVSNSRRYAFHVKNFFGCHRVNNYWFSRINQAFQMCFQQPFSIWSRSNFSWINMAHRQSWMKLSE